MMYGAPETIRTSDLNIRSVALYPTELRARRLVQLVGSEERQIAPRVRSHDALNVPHEPSTVNGGILRCTQPIAAVEFRHHIKRHGSILQSPSRVFPGTPPIFDR